MRGPRERAIARGAGALLLLTRLVAADVQAGGGSQPKTLLVSRQSANAGGGGADAEANNPAISGSGRFVAFDTDADNLGGPIDTSVSNIYVYDRERKRVELVSRESKAAGGAGADQGSFSPEMSGNGRYVAFSTDADDLGGPAADVGNIYVYDREKDKIRLVSRRSGKNGAGANEDSFSPALSHNGRFIAYETAATNLGGPLNTSAMDADTNVYIYDLEKRKTRLVSRRSGKKGQGGNDSATTPTLSANGRLVGFSTDATNLGGRTQTDVDPFGPENNIYVRNLKTHKTKLVSRRSGKKGKGGNNSSFDPFLSANGRYLGFETLSTNLGGPITNDPLDPTDADSNVYVYDLAKRKVTLVSRDSKNLGGEGGDDDSDDAWLSRSGRFIAFETDSDNLHAPPNPLVTGEDIYVYDRKRKRVELVSRASGKNGEAGDEESEDPAISYSGRFVAMEAEADNFGGPFAPGTDNKIYVRDRGR